MDERCSKCGRQDPEILVAYKPKPGATVRETLCLECALENSEVLRYLGEIAVRNAERKGAVTP